MDVDEPRRLRSSGRRGDVPRTGLFPAIASPATSPALLTPFGGW